MAGMSCATLYRKMADGTFPRPVASGTAMKRWRQSDVQAWIASLSVARPAQ